MAMEQSSSSESNRAFSRKNRVYAMREFILQTFNEHLNLNEDSECRSYKCTVLDVAGGKGILSWLLTNVDGIDSIVVDPRRTDYSNLMKSVEYLLANPSEAEKRCIRGLPTYQPLAACLKKIKARNDRVEKLRDENVIKPQISNKTSKNNVTTEIDRTFPQSSSLSFRAPRHLRMYFDSALIKAISLALTYKKNSYTNENIDDENKHNWDSYWENATKRAERTCPIYGSKQHMQTEPLKENHQDLGRIMNGKEALSIFTSNKIKLIIGFHPDQATEACIDLALLLKIPFAVCPCCVFPSEFPNRFLPSTAINVEQKRKTSRCNMRIRVRKYPEFLEYLAAKHTNMRVQKIDMMSSTARNIVLYMLPQDFI